MVNRKELKPKMNGDKACSSQFAVQSLLFQVAHKRKVKGNPEGLTDKNLCSNNF